MSAHSDITVRLTDLLDTPRDINGLIVALGDLPHEGLPVYVAQAVADAHLSLTELRAEILGVL